VPFFFKQWGEYVPHEQCGHDLNFCYDHSRVGGWVEPSGRSSIGEEAEPKTPGAAHVFKLGKKAAGHLLDGVEHHAFPQTVGG
jgi:hypothetical protein